MGGGGGGGGEGGNTTWGGKVLCKCYIYKVYYGQGSKASLEGESGAPHLLYETPHDILFSLAPYYAGKVRLGLSISCHGAPDFDPLCTFGVLHSTWSASVMVLIGAISVLTISVALFIVSLKRRNSSLVSAGKWSAFTGSK